MKEVKPCPFCGNLPQWEGKRTIYCASSRCYVRPHVHGGGQRETREHWNRRWPPEVRHFSAGELVAIANVIAAPWPHAEDKARRVIPLVLKLLEEEVA